MNSYLYELSEWPNFSWDAETLAIDLERVSHAQGRLVGGLEALGMDLKESVALENLSLEVWKSSEIEGEVLDFQKIRSSIARRLGIDIGGLSPIDRNVEGIVEVVLDATQQFSKPLSETRLFGWHAALFPTGHSGMYQILVGRWRDDSTGPMQVVSGPIGKETVHYEAPPAARVPIEMKQFIEWFEGPKNGNGILKAAVAHLWFVMIHPFEDGNGRIARAITDMALARSEGLGLRPYSMSVQIRKERNDYYKILEQTGRSASLDITSYLKWFLGCLERSMEAAYEILDQAILHSRFWQTHASTPLNERQAKVLAKLLEGFEGKLTNSKWAKITRVSADTALRDLTDLVSKGILVRDESAGRNAGYKLVL